MDISNLDIRTVTVTVLLFAALVTGAKKFWVFGWTYRAMEKRCTAAEAKNERFETLLQEKFLPALLDSTHLLTEIHESYEKEAIRAAIDRENRANR